MSSHTFGIAIQAVDAESRPAAWAQMSVVGLIGTAPAADVSEFPVDTPVHFFSNDATALANLGDTGTLPAAISLMNSQLGDGISAASVVVVRVTDDADPDTVIGNIVGDGLTTGLGAFLQSASLTGYTPRLIAAPGYTSQRTGDAANGVCAALPAVLEKLLAHAVITGPGLELSDTVAWRATINSKRLIPVEPAVQVISGASTVTVDLAPAVLGVAVRRDYERGGVPSGSWANQPLRGIVGPSVPIPFSLTDPATQGQAMLAENVGIIARGGLGADAIADSGFVLIATDNASDDALWQMYNVTRMRDFIHLTALGSLRTYLGRFNITGQTVQAILNTLDRLLSSLKAGGHILGYKVAFYPDQNSADDVRLGRIRVDFLAEETPVLKHITVGRARYRAAVDALLQDLAD